MERETRVDSLLRRGILGLTGREFFEIHPISVMTHFSEKQLIFAWAVGMFPMTNGNVFLTYVFSMRYVGRGGGDRKDELLNKVCALYALQPPLLSNWNKRNMLSRSEAWE